MYYIWYVLIAEPCQESTVYVQKLHCLLRAVGKGQLISKVDCCAIDSPKKHTDEFVSFAFLLFMANKSNSSIRFLGEVMAR